MSVYARLSFADVLELRADLVLGKRFLDGYLNVVGYLQRFGSLPANEQALASVVGCTVRYLREVAWPLLADRLAQSDDGQRYYDPEITANRPSRRAAAPTAAAKSPQQQAAAHARWRNRRGEAHPPADAQAHAEPMRTHAETHGDSMRDASETHPVGASVDASDASGALDASRADSLSLPSSSFLQPTDLTEERKEESKRESESARARAHAAPHASGDAPAHANGDASRMQSDAAAPAEEDAPKPAKEDAPVGGARGETPLSPGWKPRAFVVDALVKAGRDPGPIVAAFRAWHVSRGLTRANWHAAFDSWVLKLPAFEPKQREVTLVRSIQGGKPQSESSKLRANADTAMRRIFEGYHPESAADPPDDEKDGPVIQGVAL